MSGPLKVGDLAVVIRSNFPEKVGRICLVTQIKMRGKKAPRLAALCEFDRVQPWKQWSKRPDWDHRIGWFPVTWLRPIRDQPGEDETLTWKDKPIPLVAPESPTVKEYEYEVRSH